MSGRARDSVQIDKYALENAMLANETNAKEVPVLLGHSPNYISQIVGGGKGFMKRKDFENLKGMLRVTDTDIIKAVPVQRADAVDSIYQPVPVRTQKSISHLLDPDNEEFIGKLMLIGGGERADIVNAIIREFSRTSALAQSLTAAVDAVKALTEQKLLP